MNEEPKDCIRSVIEEVKKNDFKPSRILILTGKEDEFYVIEPPADREFKQGGKIETVLGFLLMLAVLAVFVTLIICKV